MPPGEDVAVKPIVADPSRDGGSRNETVAWPLPAVAVPISGAGGTVAGVTEFEADEALPVPTLFVAVTVKVYAVPFSKPVTVMGEAVFVPVNPPGEEVAV
jgi:hypothetical protein